MVNIMLDSNMNAISFGQKMGCKAEEVYFSDRLWIRELALASGPLRKPS
jgi:hypothetical protein